MIQDILSGNFIWLIALLIAITIHEFAHAWMANRLGDPTAKLAGRLTLNPLAHLDPIGTLMLLLARFGWGKPVPVDPFNLRNPRRDEALISFSGPASNLILATVLSIFLKIIFSFPLLTINYSLLTNILLPIIILNVSLAIFNLIPIHPLDGGKILLGILPNNKVYEVEDFLNKNGMLLLILLIFPFFGSSLVFKIITPFINLILSFLLSGMGSI